MNIRMKISGILIILVCVCLSGCDGVSDPSDLIEEGTFYSVIVSVYARVNVKNDKGEEMIPHVSIDLKSGSLSESYAYPSGSGLIYCRQLGLQSGESIVVTAVHSDGNKTYSDTKSLTFEDASNKGRRESFSWAAECSIVVPGGTPTSEEHLVNVTVNAIVTVVHFYWNESKSDYDQIIGGVSDVVRIDMRGPYSETLTFYKTTKDGVAEAKGAFALKKDEFIEVVATHQGTHTYDIKSYINDGSYLAGNFPWYPMLDLNIYMSHPE